MVSTAIVWRLGLRQPRGLPGDHDRHADPVAPRPGGDPGDRGAARRGHPHHRRSDPGLHRGDRPRGRDWPPPRASSPVGSATGWRWPSSGVAVLAVAAERERIGRDLHDILGHSLTAISIKSGLAARLVDQDPAAAKAQIDEIERHRPAGAGRRPQPPPRGSARCGWPPSWPAPARCSWRPGSGRRALGRRADARPGQRAVRLRGPRGGHQRGPAQRGDDLHDHGRPRRGSTVADDGVGFAPARPRLGSAGLAERVAAAGGAAGSRSRRSRARHPGHAAPTAGCRTFTAERSGPSWPRCARDQGAGGRRPGPDPAGVRRAAAAGARHRGGRSGGRRAEAVELARAHASRDVILMDVQMPPGRGRPATASRRPRRSSAAEPGSPGDHPDHLRPAGLPAPGDGGRSRRLHGQGRPGRPADRGHPAGRSAGCGSSTRRWPPTASASVRRR